MKELFKSLVDLVGHILFLVSGIYYIFFKAPEPRDLFAFCLLGFALTMPTKKE